MTTPPAVVSLYKMYVALDVPLVAAIGGTGALVPERVGSPALLADLGAAAPVVLHEASPCRHLHSGQRLRRHHRVLGDDAVQEEQIGNEAVNLVGSKRAGHGLRHRASDVIVEGRR